MTKNQPNPLEEALYRILECGRLDVAKEIAADAVGEDLEEFLNDDETSEMNFVDNDYPEGQVDYSLIDEEYPI